MQVEGEGGRGSGGGGEGRGEEFMVSSNLEVRAILFSKVSFRTRTGSSVARSPAYTHRVELACDQLSTYLYLTESNNFL